MCDKSINKCFLAFFFFIFLINTKHKKCVRELSMKIFWFKYTVLINIKLNVWWSSLWMSRPSSLFLVGSIQVKWLKNFLLLYMQIIIYSNFMKILAMLYFLVMKWIFLIYILIILTLMTLIIIKITLKLPFLSDFWFVIVNLRSTNHSKKDKWRLNGNSVASSKLVELFHVRRWEKNNRTKFYWVMLLVYMQFDNIRTFL